jgi:hypothetical protein
VEDIAFQYENLNILVHANCAEDAIELASDYVIDVSLATLEREPHINSVKSLGDITDGVIYDLDMNNTIILVDSRKRLYGHISFS